MTKHRVAMIDSYRLMVEAMNQALSTQEDLEVACGVWSSEEQEKVCHTQVDLILMGSNLSNFGELGKQSELIPQLQECAPQAKILLIIRAENPLHELIDALRQGADGAITTSSAFQEMLKAVRAILAGQEYLPAGLGIKLVQADAGKEIPDLSLREISVLRGIAYGHTTQEIAQKLNISTRSVENSRSSLQHTLGMSSRSQLVSYALKHDLMGDQEEWSE